MIKMVLGDSKNPKGPRLLLLGLTIDNLSELTLGRPILVDSEPLGFGHGRIAICYGDTQADILQDVRDYLGVEVPDIKEAGPGEEIRVETNWPAGG